MVNHDSDATGLLPSNTGLLELGESEPAALTNFAVVTNSLGTNGWTEEGERTDAKCGGLCLARCASAKLASWLVEPGTYAALPVLPEMVGVEDYNKGD